MFLLTAEGVKRDDSPIHRPMCIPVIAGLGSGRLSIFLEESRDVGAPESRRRRLGKQTNFRMFDRWMSIKSTSLERRRDQSRILVVANISYKSTRDKCQPVNSDSRCLICPGVDFFYCTEASFWQRDGGYTSLPVYFSSTMKAGRGRCGAGFTPVRIEACFPGDEELVIGAVVNSVLMVVFVFEALL